MRPLNVLLISDDRPGHYHLSEGVIAAVARFRPVGTRKMLVRRRRWIPGRTLSQLLSAGTPAAALLRAGYAIDPNPLPEVDLIVSAGGETLVPNAALARLTGAPNIFCGTLRRLPPQAFSLVVSSYAEHADTPRHIVALKPSGIDPDKLGLSRPVDPASRQMPPRLAGALIGGDSGRFRYQPEDWLRLLHFLQASFADHGTRWLVSTSRRSPNGVADNLAAMARQPDSPIAKFIDFRSAGPGTLIRIFERAEVILCTEDSSTMLSEAVCARLPVVGVAPQHHSFADEERGYRDYMRDNGWSRSLLLAELTPERFAAELARIRPLQENHLDRLAGSLREHLPQLFT
jgi:uncharacterized protein